MPVTKDAAGRRSVQAEVEVPGSVETVWQAIASGPGISAWFVPAEVDGRVGGSTICHFGPGDSLDSVARITAWNPPHSFVAETEENGLPVATEWRVEARSGGVCVVRVVHSWTAEGDDWDSTFEAAEGGWASFFRILALYLREFPGQGGHIVDLAAPSGEDLHATFARLAGRIGLVADRVDVPVVPGAGVPDLAGRVVEAQDTDEGFGVMVRLERPGPGILHLIGMPLGGAVHVSLRFYLYGPAGEALAPELRAVWGDWLSGELLPSG